jgi:hypothetical protein
MTQPQGTVGLQHSLRCDITSRGAGHLQPPRCLFPRLHRHLCGFPNMQTPSKAGLTLHKLSGPLCHTPFNHLSRCYVQQVLHV